METQDQDNSLQLSLLSQFIIVLSLVIWFGFQVYQGFKAKDAYEKSIANQEQALQNANKIRKSLSSLAIATKQLASQGNASAATVVSNLAARGVNISDAQTPTEAAPKP